MKKRWTLTANQLPPEGTVIEWEGVDKKIVKGECHAGQWQERSLMADLMGNRPIAYLPVRWRLATQ